MILGIILSLCIDTTRRPCLKEMWYRMHSPKNQTDTVLFNKEVLQDGKVVWIKGDTCVYHYWIQGDTIHLKMPLLKGEKIVYGTQENP